MFRDGDRFYIQSRDLKPLDRYFPELEASFRASLPERCVVDGEIVIVGPRGLDFDALQMRLHPAASRVKKLAAETPAVVRGLRPPGGRRPTTSARFPRPSAARGWSRRSRERRAASTSRPCRRERAVAEEWFHRFEGAGLDGVIAKHESTTYQPGKRAMVKVKHARTADCVVAGFRWHKQGPGTLVGSLLLGLYDDAGTLHHVGVTSSFTMDARRRLAAGARAAARGRARRRTPGGIGRRWARARQRMPGAQSRWSAGKDLSWEPLRVERVCEVKYDHLQGDRFRHAAVFLRWRAGQAAGGLPLRPARGHSPRRARRGLSPGGSLNPRHGS